MNKNFYLVLAVLFISGCFLTDLDEVSKPHPVQTLDQEQVEKLDCTFIFNKSD